MNRMILQYLVDVNYYHTYNDITIFEAERFTDKKEQFQSIAQLLIESKYFHMRTIIFEISNFQLNAQFI